MKLAPTAAFDGATLDIEVMAAGASYRRIWLSSFPDPLGFGKGKSRFSDPRRRVDTRRFGVLYLGSSLKVCFLEAVLRDDRDNVVGTFPMAETLLSERAVAAIAPTRDLKLLDLRGDGPVRMGIPSDVVRGAKQSLARAWSVAFHDHPAAIDGIIYPSRLNGEHNLAIYDRAVPALACTGIVPLRRARGLAQVLRDFKVAIV
ncbi:RES domain-containing protein [Sphingomonas sp. ABOLF]|uniref:RES family NAD+ phosphorylase n=1 Tax=Sphingomonas sp. ABOLF TaxID=1985879 RepID=UPI000F7D8E0B|nr:RES family NAD+ phosphorylase [Sphingomonas sp. ABOLF]RSV14861.1 RES domain-containing protein [Sphingomonas sp. ABOLF]